MVLVKNSFNSLIFSVCAGLCLYRGRRILCWLHFAIWLQVWLFQEMASHMLVQVTLLGESQITVQLVFERTNERSFFRVDSQVVIEVVPLPEVHWAPWEVALQDL